MFSRLMSVAAVFSLFAAAVLALTASPRHDDRAGSQSARQAPASELAPVSVSSKREQ